MVKYLKTIANALNLEEKGSRTLYGYVDGYELTVTGSQTISFYLNFVAESNIASKAKETFINTANKNFAKIIVDKYGISGTLNGMTGGSAAKNFIQKINAVVELLKNSDAKGKGYCPCCGKELDEETKTIKLNERYITLDNECYTELADIVRKDEEDFTDAPNNYLKGTIGALLGVLIGCIAWLILYFIGFLSGLTAILAIFLADLLYVKFGGKSNKVKLVIISAMTFVGMMLVCILTYYIVVSISLANNNIKDTVFSFIFSNKDLSSAFISDLIYNSIFSIVGIVLMVVNINRKNKKQHNTISE
ncbi:MAG: hypothetical protein ACI35S_06100 [Anaeroplasma sp.]